MWAVLKTTLGPLALGIYQSRKTDNPAVITEQKALGNNPYNFTSFIRLLLIGNDPGKGSTLMQNTTIRNLEQLSIRDYKYTKEFSQDFAVTLVQTGKTMDEDLRNKYFFKLPGDLGRKLQEDWNLQYGTVPKLGIGP